MLKQSGASGTSCRSQCSFAWTREQVSLSADQQASTENLARRLQVHKHGKNARGGVQRVALDARVDKDR